MLLLRYSRAHATGPMYLSSTAVCCMEALKLTVCALMLFVGEGRGTVSGLADVVKREFVEKPHEVARLAVPSLLYLLQNNLLYFALSNLAATPYARPRRNLGRLRGLPTSWPRRRRDPPSRKSSTEPGIK